MKFNKLIFSILATLAISCSLAIAQPSAVNIDPQQHGNLTAAQTSIVQAFEFISAAQRANDSHLGGHAGRAKELLFQANEELRLAADTADSNSLDMNAPAIVASVPATSGPASSDTAPINTKPREEPGNISGNWTFNAYNINQPRSLSSRFSLCRTETLSPGAFMVFISMESSRAGLAELILSSAPTPERSLPFVARSPIPGCLAFMA